MPELPEVETIRRGLAQSLIGQRFTDVVVKHPRSLRFGPEQPQFLAQLPGCQVRGVARRGKFLWLHLTNPVGDSRALVMHLGMSGQLLINPQSDHSDKHVRINAGFAGGLRLDFVDQRTFGYWWLGDFVDTPDGGPGGLGERATLVPARLSHIGRDPLDEYFNLEAWLSHLKSRSSAIKTVLLEQSKLSGVGNIYADEALFKARIHPGLPANQLDDHTGTALFSCVQATLQSAIAAGGTSFDELYVNTAGDPGYFDRELMVYGRAGQDCRRCGQSLVKTVIGGRSACYCARCQIERCAD